MWWCIVSSPNRLTSNWVHPTLIYVPVVFLSVSAMNHHFLHLYLKWLMMSLLYLLMLLLLALHLLHLLFCVISTRMLIPFFSHFLLYLNLLSVFVCLWASRCRICDFYISQLPSILLLFHLIFGYHSNRLDVVTHRGTSYRLRVLGCLCPFCPLGSIWLLWYWAESISTHVKN